MTLNELKAIEEVEQIDCEARVEQVELDINGWWGVFYKDKSCHAIYPESIGAEKCLEAAKVFRSEDWQVLQITHNR